MNLKTNWKFFLKGFFIMGILLGIMIFSLKVKAAGQSRQARFNTDVLEKVIQHYFKNKNNYPQSLEDLPNFVIVFKKDSLYLDAKEIKKYTSKGYKYSYMQVGPERFVLSASPVGVFKAEVEYAVREDGQLRKNHENIDEEADSYQEVADWPAIKRIDRVLMQ